jgi:hypothetical protein
MNESCFTARWVTWQEQVIIWREDDDVCFVLDKRAEIFIVV